jgi:hypothetical protein
MGEEIIQAQCPECGAELKIPLRLQGKAGKCGKCRTVFQIEFEDTPAPPLSAPQTPGAPMYRSTDTTKTVKLDRAQLGMIPGVKDNFHLEVVSPATAKHDYSQYKSPHRIFEEKMRSREEDIEEKARESAEEHAQDDSAPVSDYQKYLRELRSYRPAKKKPASGEPGPAAK